MKKLLFLLLLIPAANAEILSPSYQNSTGNFDEISTPKLRCRQGIDSYTRAEVGVEGDGAFAKIIVPIGRQPKRLDCSEFYKMQLEQLRIELELYKVRNGIPSKREFMSEFEKNS